MLGRGQASATNPTRLSLAQFSKNFTWGESGGRPNRASRTTEWVGQEPAEHKSFAADVVAAMSNPADERVAQLLSLGSQRRTASAD
jgi:hypothetical protein